jgi:hypothetical protein
MKKVLLILSLAFSSVSFAQEKTHLVKLHIGLLNKFKVSYEHPLSEKLSVGGALGLYYGDFPGVKVEPSVRYYFGSECPDGFYAQGRVIFGSFSKDLTYYFGGDALTSLDAFTKKVSFTSFGGGLDIGYQWLSGKNKNIIIDISLGAQFMDNKKLTESITVDGDTYTPANLSFLTTGPGAIFNPRLSIGYAF